MFSIHLHKVITEAFLPTIICPEWLPKSNITKNEQTRMWANAQRDGRPAEYMWRPLFNAAKFG